MKAWKSNRFIQYSIRKRPWKPWFAWRPVRTVGGRWYWGRTVYRKYGKDFWLDVGSWAFYFYADDFDILNESSLVEQFNRQLNQ